MNSFLKILIVGAAIGFFLKAFIVESFTVPTDSMTPTIPVGAKVWLIRLPFAPQRGAVIGFERNGESFVKRIVGIPSDWIYTEGGQFGFEILQKSDTSENLDAKGAFKIPKRGDRISLTPTNFSFYKTLIEKEGNQIGMLLDKIYLNGFETTNYQFTQNYYFVQGDNTEMSIDSRSFGLISEKTILGRVIF